LIAIYDSRSILFLTTFVKANNDIYTTLMYGPNSEILVVVVVRIISPVSHKIQWQNSVYDTTKMKKEMLTSPLVEDDSGKLSSANTEPLSWLRWGAVLLFIRILPNDIIDGTNGTPAQHREEVNDCGMLQLFVSISLCPGSFLCINSESIGTSCPNMSCDHECGTDQMVGKRKGK
jgi:hypothetical protein